MSMSKCTVIKSTLVIAVLFAAGLRTFGEEGHLTFRVKVSALGLQASQLAAGKAPGDIVEISLPGRLYDPPKALATVSKNAVDRSTPEAAASSAFSANLTGDLDWMVQNFVDGEQAEVKTFFADAAILQSNRQMFEGAKMQLTGYATYKDYVLLFERIDHDANQGIVRPAVYSRAQNGWRRTNALSHDESYDVVFSALASGEVLQDQAK